MVAEKLDIYNINELGPTTGTVFQIFANKNLDVKINTLFNTGAMKSVMSWKMYQKLNLNDLDMASIPHVVTASGESLGARGRTKCKININGRIFYQTFIVCEHLKRPIILGRDFSIQNCIGISWTKANTRQLTQNNEVIAETTEYQTPSWLSVSLKRNIKVPPRSCAVVDIDINTMAEIKVEVIPDQLWLSANPNICHIPYDSRPEGQRTKHSYDVRCRTIKQGMVFRYTWVFILKTIQWHIHAGSWSLVNCWQEALTRHYIRCS